MLSRVADSLYWMSRYLERAEHSARVVNVHHSLMLDTGGQHAEARWARVMASLNIRPPEEASSDANTAMRFLTFDTENRSSIVSCVMSARENARQVREQISSEMWEQLNRLFHAVRRPNVVDAWQAEPVDFYNGVKEGAYLFSGLADTTMNHGEGWQFIQLGRYTERANALAILLDNHYEEMTPEDGHPPDAAEYLEWIGLLRSCTAFESYCKVYTADLTPDRIAEFLILNAEFPHSVRFAVRRMMAALNVLDQQSIAQSSNRLQRLAGKLKASLDFTPIEELCAGGLHAYLNEVQRQCAQIHSAVHQVYITYPIEAALEA